MFQFPPRPTTSPTFLHRPSSPAFLPSAPTSSSRHTTGFLAPAGDEGGKGQYALNEGLIIVGVLLVSNQLCLLAPAGDEGGSD